MDFAHDTVLRDQTADLLAPEPGRRVVDGTTGGGGHAEALLERDAEVIGLDQDSRALAAAGVRLARFGKRFRSVKANFRDVRQVLDDLGIDRVDGALVDLGVSSPQLDDPSRGFSFRQPGPLDMRMDTEAGRTLGEWLADIDEVELANTIFRYGDESFSRRVAHAVIVARDAGRLTDTAALADVVRGAIPRKRWPKRIDAATRTFQALRIAVNDELGALDTWLDAMQGTVSVGGRVAIISFHSLEDRAVKRRFQKWSTGCVCPPALPICACGREAEWKLMKRGAYKADVMETEGNPRARSARLRCVQRLAPELKPLGGAHQGAGPETARRED